MAVNRYHSRGSRGEQYLLQDLITESIAMYGTDVYYLPRELVNLDEIFKDDNSSRFDNAYKIEMYIENTDGFEGDGDLFTKFGVEIRDVATFHVARNRWKSQVVPFESPTDTQALYRPQEGDLIYLPLSQSYFQIMKVEDESPFYQLKNLPTFRMTCELFEYSGEDFDTGVDDIDDIEEFVTYQYVLTVDSASGNFLISEEVLQSNTDYDISGEVIKWDLPNTKLYLAHVGADDGELRSFTNTAIITGQESNVTANVTLVEELQNMHTEAQNDIFDSIGDAFLDFSVSNPFGDPSGN